MAGQPLPPALLAETLRLYHEHGSEAQAALAAGISRSTFQNRLRCAKVAVAAGEVDPSGAAPTAAVKEPLASFEEAWRQWQRCIGMALERYAGPRTHHGNTRTQKILVCPDLHAPFHEPELFAAMIAREADADRVVCIGDLSDSYALSTYTQYRRVPFDEEWAQVTLCLQTLSESFPRVDVVIGNHDQRLEKRLRERLTPDMLDAVKYLSNGILCPISALARRYPNVHVARHEVPGGEAVDWFTTLGDAWLGHPEKFSRVPGSALRSVEEWLADHEVTLGLSRFRLIVLGHTHAYSQFLWRSGQMLIETGCLAQTQGYMLSPRIGGRPQRRGYVTFTQTQGKTDLNSVKFHWLDAEQEASA